MMSDEPAPQAPRVVAILVACNGADWLPTVLASLERLRYPALEVIAVDNASSDASADLLRAHLGDEQVLTLEHNMGFGRAVAAALAGSSSAQQADLLLCLHDDLVLAPNALIRMVRTMLTDPSLTIVGPKLREWSSERILQEVGMTIDRLGRAETHLELGELDQGQHDTQREVLYVSTAGMLVRRELFAEVGGFDARFPAFRDDLDLCWRAWIAGKRVEIVPDAVGYHIAAASRFARPVGGGRPWEPRFFAERHSIATLLKNYQLLRLAWMLPVVMLVGLVKVVGFLGTRRFGAALATVLAWVWNLFQAPRTLRRRREVQRRRERSDAELTRLFAPGLPRLREYGEALASWLAGGSTRALLDEQDRPSERIEDLTGLRGFARGIREHSALSVGVLLALIYAIGLVRLLGSGPLVGGEIAAWPEAASDFLTTYATPWGGDPLASSAFASPIQAALGAVSLLGFGSAWLAQRVAVLGLLPLAWMLAVRAGRLVTRRTGPRVFGATLYVLSPAVLGTLATGRYAAALFAALLPGILLLGMRAADAEAPAAGGWRAMALLTFALALVGAAHPTLLPVAGGIWLLGVLASLAVPRPRRLVGTLRLCAAGVLAGLLLAPWLVELGRAGWTAMADAMATVEPLPLWRALAVAPALLPQLDAWWGWVVAALAGVVALAALLLGLRRQPVALGGLVLGWVAFSLAAWGLSTAPELGLWPPLLLLPAALAQAGLGVLAARWLAGALRDYAFGFRQVVMGLLLVVLGIGVGTAAWQVANDPWHALHRDPELLPAFVTAEQDRVGPYRVVVLHADPDGSVRWDVTAAAGPSMHEYGTVPDERMLAHLEQAVAGLASGADPGAGPALGIANVRYVVVPASGATQDLVSAVDQQPGVEPVPAGDRRVWRVRTWLPRATVMPPVRGHELLSGGDPGDLGAFEETGLRAVRPGRYAGSNPISSGGVLVLSEGADDAWRAAGDGRTLERAPTEDTLVNAFVVPENITRVAVQLSGGGVHGTVVLAQLVLALAVLSLALRPPGTARQRLDAAGRELPEALDTPGDDTEGLVMHPAEASAEPAAPVPATDAAATPTSEQGVRDG